MNLVIYFESLVDRQNKGYFLRNRKNGFTSVYNVDSAKKFKSRKDVKNALDRLKDKEGKYYIFEIWEVLSNGND